MWPFKPKHKNIEQLERESFQWKLFETEMDNSPVIVRANSLVKEWAKHPSLSLQVGFSVAIPLDEEGLPSLKVLQDSEALEDSIFQSLGTEGHVFPAVTLTGGTFKEFVFYTTSNTDVEVVHKKIMQEYEGMDIACYAQYSPNWDAYFDLFGES